MAKVLGMGNALVDILTMLKSDETLEKFSLPKGSMQLVDYETTGKIEKGTMGLDKTIASGGSAANTIHGLAGLGVETGFIGKVGKDEFSRYFIADLEKNNIKPELLTSDTPTGKAMAMISLDSERTFATYLGAAVEMTAPDLNEDLFEGYDYFHIEGYLVQNHELIERAVEIAKSKGLKVSLDMASYNVVEDNLEFLQKILKNYVDIVFANEEEAKAFTGKNPEESLEVFANICDIAIVKTGKTGSMVKKGNEVHSIGAIDARSTDTTGAGDMYAAGFIYGLIKGLSLDKCGTAGSILAGKVIEVIGPKLDPTRWKESREMIKNL